MVAAMYTAQKTAIKAPVAAQIAMRLFMPSPPSALHLNRLTNWHKLQFGKPSPGISARASSLINWEF